jgi:hypothetical protein
MSQTPAEIWFHTHQAVFAKYVNQWVAIGPNGVLSHDADGNKVYAEVQTLDAPSRKDVFYAFMDPPAPKPVRQKAPRSALRQ